MVQALLLNAHDNVANAIDDIQKGSFFTFAVAGEQQRLQAIEDIPFGFKVAISPIAQSATVIKYGYAIGTASTAIPAGACVHIHNMAGSRGNGREEQ